jgi:hypothetical protein
MVDLFTKHDAGRPVTAGLNKIRPSLWWRLCEQTVRQPVGTQDRIVLGARRLRALVLIRKVACTMRTKADRQLRKAERRRDHEEYVKKHTPKYRYGTGGWSKEYVVYAYTQEEWGLGGHSARSPPTWPTA